MMASSCNCIDSLRAKLQRLQEDLEEKAAELRENGWEAEVFTDPITLMPMIKANIALDNVKLSRKDKANLLGRLQGLNNSSNLKIVFSAKQIDDWAKNEKVS